MLFKTIHIALSPNNTWRDTLAAVGMLVLPWNWFGWKRGRAVGHLEAEFRGMMGVDFAVAVGSGREALYLILKSLNLKEGDEVLVQSFTCMVVINSIIWNKLKPIYLDIEDNYNFSAAELSKKINSKTKAVIVQHTFGIPADIEKIKKVCESKKIVLIEDCAHALGASVDGRQVGTFGDMAFYSLGRSKVISCVNGGIIICSNKKYQENLKRQTENLKVNSTRVIFQNLMHPLICSLAKFLYFSQIGKILMVAAQRFKLINLEVTRGEKQAIKPALFPTKLSNAMARIALIQLGELKSFNKKRREIAGYYFKHLKIQQKTNPAEFPGAIFLRYPLQINNPQKVLVAAKNSGIILGDWYSSPIAPLDVAVEKTKYVPGECGHCEKINSRMINLPTHYSLKEKDLEKIVKIVNQNAEN